MSVSPYAAIIGALAIALLPVSVSEGGTPTPLVTADQMDRAAKPLAEYLQDVKTHWRSVESLFLQRGKVDTGDFVGELCKVRDRAGDDMEKALCDHLVARAYYWRAFHEFKATRRQELFDELRPKLVDALLASSVRLMAIRSLTGQDAATRREVVQSGVDMLATNVWGRNLTADQKQRVVREFINPAERQADAEILLPAADTTRTMYDNLGIAARFTERLLPAELPRDYQRLRTLFQQKEPFLSLEQKQRIVQCIERDHANDVAKDASTTTRVANVYLLAGQRDEGVKRYQQAAALHASYYLPLYQLSFKPEMGLANQRQAFLDAYLNAPGADSDRASSSGDVRTGAYQRVVTALTAMSQWEEIVRLVDRWQDDIQCQHSVATHAGMLLIKGQSLEALKRQPEARDTYTRFLQLTASLPHFERDRENVRRRLAAWPNKEARP